MNAQTPSDERPTLPAPWEGAPPCMWLGCPNIALPGCTRCQVHRPRAPRSSPPSRHITYTLVFDGQRIPLTRGQARSLLGKVRGVTSMRGARYFELAKGDMRGSLVVRVAP